MRENNIKWHENETERINLKKIQAAQCQKDKQHGKNVGERPKQTFLQRRHAYG